MIAMAHKLLAQDNTIIWLDAIDFIYRVQETTRPALPSRGAR
jgi:hypothetical protein